MSQVPDRPDGGRSETDGAPRSDARAVVDELEEKLDREFGDSSAPKDQLAADAAPGHPAPEPPD